MSPSQTPSQTVGPFFAPSLIRPEFATMISAETRGDRIVIEGRIIDGDEVPVSDAMVELWQANADGRYDHPEDAQEKRIDPAFHGFGRTATDLRGGFRFMTIRPGPVPTNEGVPQAPHINVSIFARGLLKRLATRIYFPDEPSNASDPLLNAISLERRQTLIARAESSPAGPVMRFDIVLQGAHETVFLDI